MSNADYQRQWRERNAEARRLHRLMLPLLVRLHRGDSRHVAWDLAKLLRECCGTENAGHIAHWLTHLRAKRPEATLATIGVEIAKRSKRYAASKTKFNAGDLVVLNDRLDATIYRVTHTGEHRIFVTDDRCAKPVREMIDASRLRHASADQLNRN